MCDKSIRDFPTMELGVRYCPIGDKLCKKGLVLYFGDVYPCIAHYKLPDGKVYCIQFKEGFEE